MTIPRDYEIQDRDVYYAKSHELDADMEGMWDPIPSDAYLLAFGIGRGDVLHLFPKALGIDFNPQLQSLWHFLGISDRTFVRDAAELPWPDCEFDWTISYDFLEHVAPENLEAVLLNIRRLAPHGIHSVDITKESVFRAADGGTLHPSANSAEWWMLAFSRLLGPVFKMDAVGDRVTISW